MAADSVTEEEFLAWRDHPVTQYVMEAYKRMAEAQKNAWMECSWDAGHCDSFELAELRTRADAYKSMSECNLADFTSAVEPEEGRGPAIRSVHDQV